MHCKVLSSIYGPWQLPPHSRQPRTSLDIAKVPWVAKITPSWKLLVHPKPQSGKMVGEGWASLFREPLGGGMRAQEQERSCS